MTDPSGKETDGSTPLTEEELQQLVPSYITLRSELNEAEQANILEAEDWAFIHPYPNGNGRHARLTIDILLVAHGRPRFSWGRVNLVDASKTRTEYIEALRAADNHDIGPLIEFVRT